MSAAIDHPSFFPYLSGRENVEVVSAFWGLDVDPRRVRYVWGTHRRGVWAEGEDAPTGMKERLELCLALVPHPAFLSSSCSRTTPPRILMTELRLKRFAPTVQTRGLSHLHASAS